MMYSLKHNLIFFSLCATLVLSVESDLSESTPTSTQINLKANINDNLSQSSDNDVINFNDNDDGDGSSKISSNNADQPQSIEDKVNLLSKQMTALLSRRREDYKLLENSLKNYVMKNSFQYSDINLEKELSSLRYVFNLI